MKKELNYKECMKRSCDNCRYEESCFKEEYEQNTR